MRVRGSELVVAALRDEGVRYTFGIPGTHNIEIYDALERTEGIDPLLVTHEGAGAFVADGYARSSDQVGVLNIVPGAGVTHALSGIAEAYMDGVPMVVLACGIREDTGHAFQLHAIDQLAVLRPVTKAARHVETADEIYPAIREAFALARSGTPGPVAIEIPANLMMLTQKAGRPTYRPRQPPAPEPDVDLVERTARLLAEARRPALYLGVGAAGASDLLVGLAERLGAPVTTTIQGKGVFPESHPLWLWNGSGNQAPAFVREVLASCDCLLAIGCRFSEVGTGSYGVQVPEKLIHVDINEAVLGRNYPAEVAIRADARAFVEALLLTLKASTRDPSALKQQISEGHAQVRADWERETSKRWVTPFRLFEALQRVCNEDAIYTTDSGNGTFLAMEQLRLEAPKRFLGPVDFSCMGYAVPAAVGAALAHPGRDVVALPGDGAFLMTGLEMLSAVRYGSPPLVCVLRDDELGQIAQFQRITFNHAPCSDLHPYDLSALAQAVGATHHAVFNDNALESVLSRALEEVRRGKLAVVEARIDSSIKTHFTKGVVKTNFARLPGGDKLRSAARAIGRRLV